MIKKKESPVPIQKGPFDINQKTYRWTTHPERLMEREEEVAGIRHAQTMEFHTPKNS